jgi:predicted secreted protein
MVPAMPAIRICISFEQTYRICTPAADIVIRRYMEEGAKIAHDITAHYAN